MPKLENNSLVWPDGTRINFASVEDTLNQITWALDMNAAILEAY